MDLGVWLTKAETAVGGAFDSPSGRSLTQPQRQQLLYLFTEPTWVRPHACAVLGVGGQLMGGVNRRPRVHNAKDIVVTETKGRFESFGRLPRLPHPPKETSTT